MIHHVCFNNHHDVSCIMMCNFMKKKTIQRGEPVEVPHNLRHSLRWTPWTVVLRDCPIILMVFTILSTKGFLRPNSTIPHLSESGRRLFHCKHYTIENDKKPTALLVLTCILVLKIAFNDKKLFHKRSILIKGPFISYDLGSAGELTTAIC